MQEFDLVVIGSGPGGYVGAIRAAQLGLKTAIIEKRKSLGGTCLNIGCIPSKALLESSELYHIARERMSEHGIQTSSVVLDLGVMMKRKDKIVKELTDGIAFLMKKNKIASFSGAGRLAGKGRVVVDSNGETTELIAKNVMLATGSEPVELPFLKFDGKRVISSTEALALDAIPERLAIIGAGAIGLEMGSVWSRLGSKVTLIEMLPRAAPFCDEDAGKALERALKRQGLDFRFNTQVASADVAADTVTLVCKDKDGKTESIVCDKVLVAVGRRPYSEGLGLVEAGVETDKRGFVEVDDQYRTTAANVYAIGDLIGGAMLAHKAEDEGVAVAEIVAGRTGHVDYRTIPNVIYTNPELAQVGMTEAEAKDRVIECRTGTFLFRANGRAKTMGETDGLVKFVVDKATDKILGVHIVGPRASELISELALAMEFHGSAEDVALTCHPHPTLSEAVREAAMAVGGRMIHS